MSLETDPRFYRKVMGLMQRSKGRLQITRDDVTMRFTIDDEWVGDMPLGEFLHTDANDIWKILGVSDDQLKSDTYLSGGIQHGG